MKRFKVHAIVAVDADGPGQAAAIAQQLLWERKVDLQVFELDARGAVKGLPYVVERAVVRNDAANTIHGGEQ